MAAEAENVAILTRLYELWSGSRAGSVEDVLAHIADDVIWRSLADGAPGMEFTRQCGCKDDVARYFSELTKAWSMKHHTVEEMIAQGERVVVLSTCAWTSNATGLTFETPKADVIRMRDGKITEFLEFYDTASALAAARGAE